MNFFKDPLDIEYMGKAGITQSCVDAIVSLIQYREKIKEVRLLSASGRHCFLLTRYGGGFVAIRSGFSSGYTGTGPKKFSYILQIFQAHNIDVDEYEVSNSIIEKIDNSKITEADILKIKSTRPVRPLQLHNYISHHDFHRYQDMTLWKDFRPIIPYGIIDTRIIDLAIDFWNNPDNTLIDGYRRLEDVFRKRTGNAKGYGTNLFKKAFSSEKPILFWKDIHPNEVTARVSLFTGAYGAHRNPRTHKEIETDASDLLSEFLLLNHLFMLERSAVSSLD